MRSAPPTAAELLAQADTWSVRERRQALPDLARAWSGDPGFGALLADLAAEGPFGARMSLRLAEIGGAAAHLGSLLKHPDAGIAASAIKAAVRIEALASEVETAFPGQSRAVRLAGYAALRKYRSPALADRLLPVIAERYGTDEAAQLLPACTSATVAANLPAYASAIEAWAPFAKHHCAAFTAYARATLAERRPEQWQDWWSDHYDALPAAIEQAPLDWLELLERHSVSGVNVGVAVTSLRHLLAADADRAWNLLLDPRRRILLQSLFGHNAHLRRIAAEPASRIAALVRGSGRAESLPRVLKHLPPSRRVEVLTAIRDAGGHVDDESVLALLPWQARTETARRLLGDRRVAGSAPRRDTVRSHLPFAEVRDDFAAATRRSDVQERARAYGHLIDAAALACDSGAVGELLGLLGRTAGDQGLVHDAVLRSLLRIRARDWTAAHLEILATLHESWLASPARPQTTVSHMLTFAVRLIHAGMSARRPHLTAFGELRLQRLLTEASRWEFVSVLRRLPRRFTVDLANRAAPALEAKAEVDDYSALFVLATALDGDLAGTPGIEPLLRRALHSRSASQVTEAVTFLAGIRAGRHDRLGELARAFPDRGQLVPALARYRCDLLPERLASLRSDNPMGLNHVTAFWSPHVIGDWPPAVLSAYLATLQSIATDVRRKDVQRASAARAMVMAPQLPLAELRPLLRGDDPRIRAIAIGDLHHAVPAAAVWEALPAYLDSGDAPVAAAVMDRLAHVSRPELIAAQVVRLLDSPKVTVRKQVVRVLARHRVEGAAGILTGLWADEDLHPSVREAVASVAAECLAEPWARAVVGTVDGHAPDVQAAALGLAPGRVPAEFRPRYVELLTAAASDDDALLQVTGSSGLARWARHETRAAAALVGLASDLDGGNVWAAAMNALCANVVMGADPEPLLRAVDLLNAEDDEPEAEEDRDLPVRQRFERIVSVLSPLYGGPPPPKPAVAALTDRLPADLGTRLLAGTVDWDAGPEAVRALVGRIADPVEAVLVGEVLNRRMGYSTFTFTLGFVTALAETGEPHGPIVAARLIENAAEDWDEPWRDLLRRLRSHSSSMVRVLAGRVYTAEEYEGAAW